MPHGDLAKSWGISHRGDRETSFQGERPVIGVDQNGIDVRFSVLHAVIERPHP